MSAETLLWIAIGVALWVAVLTVVVALGMAAKRGDAQLATPDEDAHELAAGTVPVSSSEILADACRVLGAGRGALLAARDTADEPRVLACHPGRESLARRAADPQLVACALAGEGIVATHAPVPDRPERWAVQALAVPVGATHAHRAVLYFDGFRTGHVLGTSDRRFLAECAAGLGALVEPRFTRAPAAARRL